ncbi:MAG: ParB/RepB/Spo0J family partition protein [Acidimicrobiia bacterium]
MSARRGGLGRGLEALIPKHDAGDSPFAVLPLDDIRPNPHQPRSVFDDDALASMADSIAEVGVLQPVIVRPDSSGEGYLLVAGERRCRAARRAGLTSIPAMVRAVDDRSSLTEALVENLQREDLTPLEEAAAYQQLLEDFGLTHDQIGGRVGKSRSAVTNTLRLLQLPAAIQGMLERGELSAGHARALLGLSDHRYAEHVARRAVDEGWSVRQVEEAVRVRREAPPVSAGRPKVTQVRPAAIIELEQRLTERLGVPVSIRYYEERGRVEIRFSSLDELEEIYRRFFT